MKNVLKSFIHSEDSSDNSLVDNPFAPVSANEILDELAESRACYARGEYQDFDEALDEIKAKYGI